MAPIKSRFLLGWSSQSLATRSRRLTFPEKTEVNVTLQGSSGALADVVVVGYGTQRKRDVTGTISSVKRDDFKNLPVSSSAQALQGRASGVDIIRSDSSPGSFQPLYSRYRHYQ